MSQRRREETPVKEVGLESGPLTELLYSSPDNPLPQKASAGMFDGFGGVSLRYALFGPTGGPLKGTVILLQGRNESIEKYFETIRDLAASGFQVATFDFRGQGGSGRLLPNRRRGHVRSFSRYVADLHKLFDEIVLPDCRPPYYVLAHSTGGLVALLAAPLLINRVRRMVLSAPLLGFAGIGMSTRNIRRLTGALRAFGLGRASMGKGGGERPSFAGNVLTGDLPRFRRNTGIVERHPELGLGSPTVAWVNAACKAIDKVTDGDFIARINIPILFVAAGADQVVSNAATAAYERRLRSGSLIAIDGARHEIMQEADFYREQFLAAFNAFVPGADAPELL